MSFRLLFQLQLSSLWLTKNPALPDWSARQFRLKHCLSSLMEAEPVALHFFCLNTERPKSIDNVNLSIPKSWRDLLLYECQLHGMYSGNVRLPTNTDCMSRLYGVEPNTDCRDIWHSGYKSQKPGSQVHSEEFRLRSLLCSAFSCPKATLLLSSPCCIWMVVTKDWQGSWWSKIRLFWFKQLSVLLCTLIHQQDSP